MYIHFLGGHPGVYIHVHIQIHIQLILINHGVSICKFAYSLKFVTLKSILMSLSWSFTDMHAAGIKLNHRTCMFPAEVEQAF